MKFINKALLSGLMATLIISGCKKESTKNVSQLFTVPIITIKGSELVTLAVGASYTDAGADYTGEDGNTSPLAATSTDVNTGAAGLYFVNYKKTSASTAFETEETRLVSVTSVNDPVNYSGEYLRAATGASCFVEKVANGVYKVTNPGGAPTGTDVVVYYVETAVGTFVCPSQPSTAGPFGVNEIAFTPTGASWRVVNSGYGTGVRTFAKQ